jgi:hypothetical protein
MLLLAAGAGAEGRAPRIPDMISLYPGGMTVARPAALLLLAVLSACAAQRAAPPAVVAPAEEPVPAGIKPLTTEQDEEIAG